MDYQIVLAPDLGVSLNDFVIDWNAADEVCSIGQARLASSNSTSYDSFLLSTIAVISSTVSLGVVTNAIYDLIKRISFKHGVRKHIHISCIDQPDGTRILVVDIEEKS